METLFNFIMIVGVLSGLYVSGAILLGILYYLDLLFYWTRFIPFFTDFDYDDKTIKDVLVFSKLSWFGIVIICICTPIGLCMRLWQGVSFILQHQIRWFKRLGKLIGKIEIKRIIR